MPEKMTRGEVQEVIAKLAFKDPQFREALIRDPKAVIERQFNTSLGTINVQAVVEAADTLYVVVPHVPAEGEMSDSDLEKVAGGKHYDPYLTAGPVGPVRDDHKT